MIVNLLRIHTYYTVRPSKMYRLVKRKLTFPRFFIDILLELRFSLLFLLRLQLPDFFLTMEGS